MTRTRARTISLRLPSELVERASAAAATCGLSVNQFIAQTAHGALAVRLCQHPEAAPPRDQEADGDDGDSREQPPA